jgi:hypothetical protein
MITNMSSDNRMLSDNMISDNMLSDNIPRLKISYLITCYLITCYHIFLNIPHTGSEMYLSAQMECSITVSYAVASDKLHDLPKL